MDLAQMNRAFLPRWLNIGLWLMAEASIICTDISQVCPIPLDLLLRTLEKPSPCRFHLSKHATGYRHSNCHQPLESQNTHHRRLRHIGRRHSLHPLLLQTRWELAETPSLRDICLPLRYWNLHHVLHRALLRLSTSPRRLPRLCPISRDFRWRGASLPSLSISTSH
jgi:hypothetical protein